jgi:hypothetical protein
MHKGPVLMSGFCIENPADHLQTGIAQALQAATGYARIRVGERHHNPLNASGKDCFGAWWCSALVAAGFQGDHNRAATGRCTSLLQGSRLGMGLSGARVETLSHQAAL